MKNRKLLFTILLLLTNIVCGQAIGKGVANHTIFTDNNGTVYTWGYNYYGQLGNGNNSDSNVPVDISESGALSGKTINKVAKGFYHSLALDSNGKVYAWGRNNYGQLGNGNNTDSNVPIYISTSGALSGKTIMAIAAGYYHSLALDSNGKVYAWGYNNDGELGNGNNSNSSIPVDISASGALSGKTIVAIACGYFTSIALASDGTVYTWGYNNDGALGNGNNSNSNVPVAVETSGVLSGKIITAIAAGAYHVLASSDNGEVFAWGNNYKGQLGDGSTTQTNVPVAVTTSGALSGKVISEVAGGLFHSLALADDGTVYSWGYNNDGQLGNGNNTDSKVPVAVTTNGALSGKNITSIAGGVRHSVALDSEGAVYAWGLNNYGQLGTGDNNSSNIPVLSNAAPLPVELTLFTAEVNANIIYLSWQTATEINNYGFEIEFSEDKINWEKIGFVSGNGNSNSGKVYSFVDNKIYGKYNKRYYRLKQIDVNGNFEYSDVVEVVFDIPTKFSLEQNYPNPFNPTTTISYTIPQMSKPVQVSLKVYNVLGKEVATLVNEKRTSGNYKIVFNANDLPSGVYYYSLQASNYKETKRLMLIK